MLLPAYHCVNFIKSAHLNEYPYKFKTISCCPLVSAQNGFFSDEVHPELASLMQ